MNEQRLRVAIIIGSIRQGRFGPTVAGWFAGRACRRDDLEVDVIDLAEAWLPGVLPGTDAEGPVPAAVRDLAPWLATADAFVIVTPEYNHSFPASLKNAIDWYEDEWRAKPVAFVSSGDGAGGLRAVEHLRLVFAGLEAVTVSEAVSFHNYRDSFDPALGDAGAERMLDRLTWWARARVGRRAARRGRPRRNRRLCRPYRRRSPGGGHRRAARRRQGALVGAISGYDATEPVPGPTSLFQAYTKELTLRGMLINSYFHLFPEYIGRAAGWLADGSLRTEETVVEGIAQAPSAFLGVMRGANTGKMLVRLDG